MRLKRRPSSPLTVAPLQALLPQDVHQRRYSMMRPIGRFLSSAGRSRVVEGSALVPATFVQALGVERASVEALGGERASVLGGERASVLLTDPPYCRLVRRRDPARGARQRKLASDATTLRFDNMAHYATFTRDWMTQVLTCGLLPKADMIIWTNPLGRATIISEAQRHNYTLADEFAWAKRTVAGSGAATNTNEVLVRVHESALILRHTSASTFSTIASNKEHWSLPRAVITDHVLHDHPCHKPLSVVLPLVHGWTKGGDLVLDCFAGSGAICEAVVRAGGARRAVGIEISGEWAKRANDLLLQAQQAEPPLF